jgi:hypothetical protein
MTRFLWVLVTTGCMFPGPGEEPPILLPDATAATFVAAVDNPFFPLPVGATWTYEADTADGLETDLVEVLPDVEVIEGVDAVSVRDTVLLDGELAEDTIDWYAQDDEGNVWYLGEDTCEFENDQCVDTHGTWKWGVDGALPGIVMWGDPMVDHRPYYQEYFVGEAEDVGEVVALGLAVDVPVGSFTGCLQTEETSTLDPTLLEEKFYCPGLGNVKVDEDEGIVELVATTGL